MTRPRLRTLLVVKNVPGSYARDDRPVGLFSYDVPDWSWTHVVLGPRFVVDTRRWSSQVDLVVHIDGSNWGTYRGPVPIVYIATDSTLSDDHARARIAQARQADLVLVDHDDPRRFVDRHGRPGIAFPHAVNDRLFYPRVPVGDDRPVDVAFACGWHQPGGNTRREIAAALIKYGGQSRRRVEVGPRSLEAYAALMGSSAVVVNWPRTPTNRPHRVLDAMASGACLITGPLPDVPADGRADGRDYLTAGTVDDLVAEVDQAIRTNAWRQVAATGYILATCRHTWAVRAAELRALVARYLKR